MKQQSLEVTGFEKYRKKTRKEQFLDEMEQITVGPEYSCSRRKIDMVKAVEDGGFNKAARFRCSYGTTVRRVAVRGLVCSPRMVVIQIRRHSSLGMPLVEHDENEQHLKRSSRDNEKVDRCEISYMLVQECSPCR